MAKKLVKKKSLTAEGYLKVVEGNGKIILEVDEVGEVDFSERLHHEFDGELVKVNISISKELV